MPIISGGRQKTLAEVLDQAGAEAVAPAESAPSRRRLRRPRGGPAAAGEAASGAPPEPPPERIGVVWVHGIGAQQPGESLLDWTRPVIKVLTEWRERHGWPPDPVVASRIDFTGASQAIIQLDVPGMPPDAGDRHDYPHQTWFVTEAWWASNVRAPSLGTMARWLSRDMGRVVSKVQEAAADRRRSAAAAEGSPAVPEPGWVRAVDIMQSFSVATLVGILWLLGGGLGVVYALLRGLPIIGDRVQIAQLDSFLVDWFGDLRVLLHDPAQAANIRGRLAESLATLRDEYRCSSIVVIAHSGGVIVSLTTLGDELFATKDPSAVPNPNAGGDDRVGAFPVTKLMTIGQAMGTGWNLWNAWNDGLYRGDRLLAAPFVNYPRLRWVDFWGTYDPAPAGAFPPEPPIKPWPASDAAPAPQEVADRATAAAAVPVPAASPPVFRPTESRPVWNRMSFREDHGGYWDNDEQFIIPLVREIDTASGSRRRSRFFRGRDEHAVRVARRIERVAVLGWWRWLTAIAAVVALGGALLHRTDTGNRLAEIGAFSANAFAQLPAHEVASSPIDAVAKLAVLIGGVPVIGPALAIIGQVLIGLVVALVLTSIPGWYGWWRALSRRLDPDGRFGAWLARRHWPSWLPPRIALAIGLYVAAIAAIGIGLRLSMGWALELRAWLADRVGSPFTAETGNLVFGALVVLLVFVLIEVWGASRWQGWDERERWEARRRPLPPADRGRIKIQAVLFLGLLATAVLTIAVVGVH